MLSRLFVALLAVSTLQDTGLLRIRVTLADSTGAATPIPRVLLLVSDNPATGEPRRVRTTADGTVELKLPPGNYTVESDQPLSFGGSTYLWTQDIDVVAGRAVVLDLTAQNAAVGSMAGGAGNAFAADSAVLLSKWRDSVVEIWTPTTHASGFVIEPKGLIATAHRALGDATDVEVEITSGRNRLKVPGVVAHSDRLTGAAIIRIDPEAVASVPSHNLKCPGVDHAIAAEYKSVLTAITAPIFSDRELVDGEILRHNAQAIFTNMRVPFDAAGGPVFGSTGELTGIVAVEDVEQGARRSKESFVVPMAQLCATLTAAEKKLTGPPPRGIHLPLDPPRSNAVVLSKPATAARRQPLALSSSDFDITLLTPDVVRSAAATPRTDLANWTEYVRDAPPMLLIRVSPQFEESFWKMLARGAASTQGVALPPLKSFTSNFLKLRAYCGDAEVTPIHPFVIERQVSDKAAIREGLYAFDSDALGARCPSVRLAIYSEKAPNSPDVKTIDPKLFEQLK